MKAFIIALSLAFTGVAQTALSCECCDCCDDHCDCDHCDHDHE
jgi:hypothetical protein